MKCPRCGNEDPAYFYHGTRGWYCRRCVQFKRQYVWETMDQPEQAEGKAVMADYALGFTLTDEQQQAARAIVSHVRQGHSVMVCAVTGAGKTELSYALIRDVLRQGKRIGFAIPRREVVIQLAKRMQAAFSNCSVIAVCEGFTTVTEADLIVCTTHQLYRYPKYFDVLIVDEPDAFPYADYPMLQAIAHNSCRGPFVEMSATFEETVKKTRLAAGWKLVELSRRPSGIPLPIPRCIYGLNGALWLYLLKWMVQKKREGRRCLIFMPSIRLSKRCVLWLRSVIPCACLHSHTEEKADVIARFQNGTISFLFTTTILERGVTFAGIDVAVMYADHMTFRAASLIQIAGRVGRGVEDTSGEGVFLCRCHTESIDACLADLRYHNRCAFGA